MKNSKVNKRKKEKYCKCKKCGEKICLNTHKRMIYCKCGAVAVDGCEYYTRIIGDEKDYKIL